MGRFFGVCGVQNDIFCGDTEKNVSMMEGQARAMCGDFPWINLIMWSELAVPGFNAATLESQAEPIPGPTTDRFAALAKELGVYVVPGSMFELADGKIYNTIPVLAPDGSLVTTHRKHFPWRPLEPSEPGKVFTVFDIPGVARFGICNCYEFWFPETTRQLTWLGAEMILHPTMTPTQMQGTDKEICIGRTRAMENGVYVFNVSGTGQHGGLGLGGCSYLADPDGNIVERLDRSPNMFASLINFENVDIAQGYGTVATTTQTMKHLAEYNLPLPMYEAYVAGKVTEGEFFKKRGPAAAYPKYATVRNITLPFTP
jgi:deaminated glutathione amidase